MASNFDVSGVVQCAPSGRGIAASVVAGRVVNVLTVLGQSVKKGDPLVQLDPTSAQARLQSKQCALESALLATRYLKRVWERSQAGVPKAVSLEEKEKAEKEFHQAQQAVIAATIDVQLAQKDLDDCTVKAPCEGIVSQLDVYCGMIAQGGTAWGEVWNADQDLDALCQLDPSQADIVPTGSPAVLVLANGKTVPAKVPFVGVATKDKDPRYPCSCSSITRRRSCAADQR